MAKIIATFTGRLLGAPVRRLTYVVGMGTGRIHLDELFQALLLQQAFKHTMRRGRTADIAHAHEKNANLLAHTTHN